MDNLFDIDKIERSKGCDYYKVELRVDGTEQLFLLLDFIDNYNLEAKIDSQRSKKNV